MTLAHGHLHATSTGGDETARAVAAARAAQGRWGALPPRERLRPLKAFRHRCAAQARELADAIDSQHRTPAEKLASEVIPLADAVKFLERNAARLLRPQRFGRRGRPVWLGRMVLEVRREPLGVVLIVSPSNYPLFLPGVQVVQALAAGNAVLVKPAPGQSAPMHRIRAMLDVDEDLFAVLPEAVGAVNEAVQAGADKVVLTGSAETGQAVLELLAPHLTPATMELSGHDAVFVCPDADLELVARSIAYALTLNGGATCIAPRRVFVPAQFVPALEVKLRDRLAALNPLPPLSIVPVADMRHALALNDECPYALGATVFGSASSAAEVAGRVNAGCVVVNDAIVPTADPRLPFGGRGRSGFGVTRGAEGLLEMTRVKAIATRGGAFRPHLEPPHALDEDLFRHYLTAAHGPSLADRARGAARAARTLWRRSRS